MNVKKHLTNAIQLNKVSHAYIFHGEPGAGKQALAEWFAKRLQCQEEGTEPCGRCQSCLQMDGGNQPDVIFVTPEKETTIGVDDVREQINNSMAIKPYSSPYKVFIVNNAQKMTIQAQNALLKTLEEPPVYGVLILLTTNTDIFLPTIRSRCVILNFDPIQESVRLERRPELQEVKNHSYKVMNEISRMSLEQVYDIIKEISGYKKWLEQYFDYMLQWHKEELLKKETGQSTMFSYSKCSNNITAIEEARDRIKANVNTELVLEMLLFSIKEKE